MGITENEKKYTKKFMPIPEKKLRNLIFFWIERFI